MPRNVPSWATTVWPRRTPSPRILGGLDEISCFLLVIVASVATAALNNQVFVHVVCGLEVEISKKYQRKNLEILTLETGASVMADRSTADNANPLSHQDQRKGQKGQNSRSHVLVR